MVSAGRHSFRVVVIPVLTVRSAPLWDKVDGWLAVGFWPCAETTGGHELGEHVFS
jgi:hypothetical protein